MDEREAWARFAEDMAQTYARLATRLRDADDPGRAPTPPSPATTPPPRSTRPDDPMRNLGQTQRRVLAALQRAHPQPLSSREVAVATGVSDKNTPKHLSSLHARGLVREVRADNGRRTWALSTPPGTDDPTADLV